MSSAEQHAVGEVGAAAGCPRTHVLGFGPAGGSIAAGEDAAAVAVRQCHALPGGEESLLSPDVEHLAVTAEDDG